MKLLMIAGTKLFEYGYEYGLNEIQKVIVAHLNHVLPGFEQVIKARPSHQVQYIYLEIDSCDVSIT